MEPPLSLESAIEIIFCWNAEQTGRYISDGDCSKINDYLEAVDVIQKSVSLPGYQTQVKEAICMAVARLKLEFLNILTTATASRARVADVNKSPKSTTLSSSMSGSTTTTSYEINAVHHITPSQEAICYLSSIAKRMSSAGYVGECIEVYKSVRKAFLETSLKQLGIDKFSTRGLLLEEFKEKIDLLIRAAKMCYIILFSREKKLFGQIFDGIEGDLCISSTVKDAEVQLMSFAEALISSRRSPDKLFKFLDLSKELLDIWLLLDFTNFSRAKGPEGALVLRLYDRLGEVVRVIVSDFEKSVVYELSNTPEAGGTIHFLTKYVMDYINHMKKYKKILSDFIISNPPTTFGDLAIPDVEFVQLEGRGQGRAPLALHLVLIIVVLRFKLEDKSKYYKDASLAQLFMANNLHYIVQSIQKSPELEEMIGEEYMNKLNDNYLGQAMSNYQRATCEKMLHCLRDDDEKGVSYLGKCFYSTGDMKRRRIKSFNAMFEAIRSTQARWVVQHLHLREELRLSIVEKLIPAYTTFLEQYESCVERRKHPYIKYSVEDLQSLIIEDFFRTY